MWGRQLVDGWALAFVNNDASATNVTCDAECFGHLFTRRVPTTVAVRDLWLHQQVATLADKGQGFAYTVPVDGDGGVRLFKLTAM